MFSAIPGRDDEQRWIPSPPDHPPEVKLKTALCRLKHTQVQDKNSWVPVGPRLAGCRVSSAEGVNSTSSEEGPGLWESVIVHVVNALHVSVFELPEKATLSRVNIQRSVNAIAFGVVQLCIEVASCIYVKWCLISDNFLAEFLNSGCNKIFIFLFFNSLFLIELNFLFIFLIYFL